MTAGTSMKHTGDRKRRQHQWFDEKSKQSRWLTRGALQAFRTRSEELS